MCIRDSPEAAAVRRNVAVQAVEERRFAPVSYTHLDVYKRQEDDTADIPVRTRGAAAGRSAQPQHRADGTNRSRRMEVHIPEEKLSPGAGRHMPRKEDDRR